MGGGGRRGRGAIGERGELAGRGGGREIDR